jgi:hypothetical protein
VVELDRAGDEMLKALPAGIESVIAEQVREQRFSFVAGGLDQLILADARPVKVT